MGLQPVFVKSGNFIRFKGSGITIPREQRAGAPEKPKTPRNSPEKWTFLSLAFTMHPVVHTVEGGPRHVSVFFRHLYTEAHRRAFPMQEIHGV